MKNCKYAVLSMDVEDWFQLDYFQNKQLSNSFSMLDGFTNYLEILNQQKIKTTFFILSGLSKSLKKQIIYADKCGHEIACHGKNHTRPMTMTVQDFERELREAKDTLEDLIGKEVVGYRAPCYSIDNARYEILKQLGFKYSSSRMDIPSHPLYGSLDLRGYNQPKKGIYEKDGFYEFSLSTKKFYRGTIAVSGGGWIRIFPWECFMKPMIKSYLRDSELYTMYIHPFELSRKQMPRVNNVSILTNIRARRGLGKVQLKVKLLIDMLRSNDFQFGTFYSLIDHLSV